MDYKNAPLVPGITTTPLFEGGLRRLSMFATYFNLQAPLECMKHMKHSDSQHLLQTKQ